MIAVLLERKPRTALSKYLNIGQVVNLASTCKTASEVLASIVKAVRPAAAKKSNKKKEVKQKKPLPDPKKKQKEIQLSQQKQPQAFKIKTVLLKQLRKIVKDEKMLTLEPDVLTKFGVIPKPQQHYFSYQGGLLTVCRPLIDDKLSWLQCEEEEEYNLEQFFSGVGITDLEDKASILRRQKEILAKVHQAKQKEEYHELRKHQRSLCLATGFSKFIVILCMGGHFTIANFEGDKCISHRSDHAYVCRGKAGGRQLTKDKQKSISSIGSQIRRANEVLHQQKIAGYLAEFKDSLARSDLIFVHAPGPNKLILLESGLAPSPKVRNICSSVKKAKFQQAQSVFKQLTTATWFSF